MLRNKGLTDKLLLLGVDGMDPRFTKRLVEEGKMPNVKKLMDMGSCRDDLMMLGAMPTITPPMWATLATGCYPMTHGIIDYNLSPVENRDLTIAGFSSVFMKAEPLFNVTAKAGKKTFVMHWPGGSFPPSIDSENLITIDGSSPGAVCSMSSCRDEDTLYIASVKAEKPSFTPYGANRLLLEGDEILEVAIPCGTRFGISEEAQSRLKEYRKWYKGIINVEGFTPESYMVADNIIYPETHGCMWGCADVQASCSISPIDDPNGWAFDVPEGAREFMITSLYGRLTRYALILKNEAGIYDKVAIYKDKTTTEPLGILENDVFTDIYDTLPKGDREEKVFRNMRAFKIAEDGSYVSILASKAMSCENDTVWFPRTLFKEVTEKFGYPQPGNMMTCNADDFYMKFNKPQWEKSAKWQSNVMNYMIEEHGVEVIFSHMHNIDMQAHQYIKYMKNRDNSVLDENEVVKFAEAAYKITDDYLGDFMHLLDKGWTIILFSDHALISPEEEAVALGSDQGVCVEPFRSWGYTVMKVDENGNELPEVDLTKSKAIMTHCNSIYINLKGREPQGIVDPADKYEFEEEIITKLYELKHEKTGKRLVSLALHNKDAVLLGMGGEYAADIIYVTHETYVADHGAGLSTAYGYNDTSLSPIFVAAGKGIKENFRTKRYIREVDLAPTAAVLLGVDMPAECEGAPAYQIFTENI